ncbi:MAG: phytanoyl-CoA dioxygenase family protein [Candidatus Latescibacterota bacterium]|nr:phytanoyl-CoA dioxygenase family protein [Candidatus Latescibacterota bacterium]
MTSPSPLAVTSEQKQFFDDNGYLHLPGFYAPAELKEMRRQYHEMVTKTDGHPQNMSYSFMASADGYEPDDFNPNNVVGMMDQTLYSDYWFDQFTEPRVISVMVDLLGPNLDFHNGKVRNKPPGFFADQGWHQDWPYELHSEPDLAAAITYLDSTDFEQGATEVISGSHKAGFLPTEEGKSTLVQEDVNDSARVVLKAEAGDVAVIHVQVVHRAGHNYTARSRNAIINEYKTAETVDHWGNRCAFAGLPLARNRKLLMPRVHRAG